MRQDLLTQLHRLQEAGHLAGFAGPTMQELGMDVTRIGRHVERTEAGAWIVE